MTEPMTDARLAQIEALAAAATLDLAREIEDHRAIPASVRIWSPTLDDFVADFFHNRADAEFYFAARTAVPELITEVRRLRATNAELEKRDDWLRSLEAAGVDNWDGIDFATEIHEREA